MNISKLTYSDCDGYIVTSEHNRYYFTGFHSSFGILIATPQKGFYITDNRYAEVCKNHFIGSNVEAIIGGTSAACFQIAKDIVSAQNIKVMGFEDIMSVREFNDLKEVLPCEFIEKGKYFELIRSVKTEEEIEKIKNSMELSSRAFDKMLERIKVGMTEKEICAELNYQIYRMGADSLAFDTIVASGVNGSHPHAVPSERKVGAGELVTLDFGARVDGYCADITRTIAFGKLSPEREKLYDTVLTAQKLGCQSLKAGVTGGEIDGVVREYFKSCGLDQYFIHSLGHGVGVEIHEEPRLAPNNTTVLEENMIVTIEPGLYIPGEHGVRIEDTVVVTKTGIVNLATCNKELITIKA